MTEVKTQAATSDETAPPLPELMTVLAFAMYAMRSEYESPASCGISVCAAGCTQLVVP